jgi:ribonuclease Z
MATDPQTYRLSRIPIGEFSLMGYSVAGEESIVLIPELDVAFDIGKCPREALTINHILLTHTHADHSAGLLYYFAQRDFQGIEGGTVLVPAREVDPTHALLKAWGRFEGHVPPYRVEGIEDGEDYELRRGLIARAFDTRHSRNSLGFSILDVRHKLKPEYAGLTGPEIVKIKEAGKPVTNRMEMPLVACPGDTPGVNYSDLPHVRDARVLLLECTFWESEHVSRARHGNHVHIRDLPAMLEGMNNEHIVLTHVTRRTHLGQARRMLRKMLPADVLERTTFLMSRKHTGASQAAEPSS